MTYSCTIINSTTHTVTHERLTKLRIPASLVELSRRKRETHLGSKYIHLSDTIWLLGYPKILCPPFPHHLPISHVKDINVSKNDL